MLVRREPGSSGPLGGLGRRLARLGQQAVHILMHNITL